MRRRSVSKFIATPGARRSETLLFDVFLAGYGAETQDTWKGKSDWNGVQSSPADVGLAAAGGGDALAAAGAPGFIGAWEGAGAASPGRPGRSAAREAAPARRKNAGRAARLVGGFE
jgi:hypothetical protein